MFCLEAGHNIHTIPHTSYRGNFRCGNNIQTLLKIAVSKSVSALELVVCLVVAVPCSSPMSNTMVSKVVEKTPLQTVENVHAEIEKPVFVVVGIARDDGTHGGKHVSQPDFNRHKQRQAGNQTEPPL